MKLAESKKDGFSSQAVRALGRELSFERTTAILHHALHRRRIETACACLEALGGSGTAEAVHALAKVLDEEGEELAIAAAQALGTTGNAAAEAPLLLALRRPQLRLRVAAVKALGRIGSVAAVLPLKEAAKRFSRQPELVQAVRQAIAEIQARLPGASPGQLSLAGAEAGRLSLTQAKAGQLSLATKAAGQLSFSDDQRRPKPAPGGTA
jgi:HEAT repeat protein